MQTEAPKARDDAPTRAPFPYLCLGSALEIRDEFKQLSDLPFTFIGHRPVGLAGARALVKSHNVVTSLALLSDPSVAGGSLSAGFPLHSVLFPPVAVLARRAPTAEEQELLRAQGVAHVFELPFHADRDGPVLESLSRSHSWMTSSVDRMPLPDVLQMMSVHSQSGMLTIFTPSTPNFSAEPWSRLHEASQCGRLYVVRGRLVCAETPSAGGIDALAALLRMSVGLVRVHEVFLRPVNENIRGSLQSNLIEAAWRNDEGVRRPGKNALPAATTWRPSAPPAGELQSVADQNIDLDPTMLSPPRPPGAALSGDELRNHDHNPVVPRRARRASGSAPAGHGGTSTPAIDISFSEREKTEAMSNLETLLKHASELRVCAKADKEGNVFAWAGTGEVESMCAVAALATPAVEGMSELLALGDLEGYSFVGQKLALYVHQRADGFVAALGEPSKSTETTMKKLAEVGPVA